MINDLPDDLDDPTAGAKSTELAEAAIINKWILEIDRVREFDREAYIQLARDRKYAAGDSSFPVSVNLIGGYIDNWNDLLYARDPEIDVEPNKDAGTGRAADAELFSDTLEIVLARVWKRAKVKDQAKPWTRASLTSMVGFIKCSWQSRMGRDPMASAVINDLQTNIARLNAQLRDIREGEVSDVEEAKAQAELTLAGIVEQAEVEIARGMAFDNIDLADLTISDGAPSIARYLESPWISHASYLRVDDAKALYPDVPLEKLKAAATFVPRKPVETGKKDESGALVQLGPDDARTYVSGGTASSPAAGGENSFLCVEEIWCRDNNQVITIIRGMNCFPKKPYVPEIPTERFYPFFGLILVPVDGKRWPDSLNSRSQGQQDEYNRTISQWGKHRKRAIPKVGFNSAELESGEAKKLSGAAVGEMVGFKMVNPKTDIRNVLFPIAYPSVDPGLYDTAPIEARFERIWGLQEAATGTVDVDKTATEAEIQNQGTQSRTGSKRDDLENVLTELANYTAQIVLDVLDLEDVRALAGPEAFWPEDLALEDIFALSTVTIRAGSTGKPNTAAQRRAWSETLPLLEGAIEKIGALRQADPLNMANCYEELAKETVARSGDHIDISRFMPKVGQPKQLVDPMTKSMVLAFPVPGSEQPLPPMPGDPGAPAGPPDGGPGPVSEPPAPAGPAM